MRKFIKLAFVAAFAAIAGYGVYCNQNVEEFSGVVLANIEALAMEEIPGPIDPNKAYGYELQDCYDKDGRITGATCVQVEDRESECKYSSAWGKC